MIRNLRINLRYIVVKNIWALTVIFTLSLFGKANASPASSLQVILDIRGEQVTTEKLTVINSQLLDIQLELSKLDAVIRGEIIIARDRDTSEQISSVISKTEKYLERCAEPNNICKTWITELTFEIDGLLNILIQRDISVVSLYQLRVLIECAELLRSNSEDAKFIFDGTFETLQKFVQGQQKIDTELSLANTYQATTKVQKELLNTVFNLNIERELIWSNSELVRLINEYYNSDWRINYFQTNLYLDAPIICKLDFGFFSSEMIATGLGSKFRPKKGKNYSVLISSPAPGDPSSKYEYEASLDNNSYNINIQSPPIIRRAWRVEKGEGKFPDGIAKFLEDNGVNDHKRVAEKCDDKRQNSLEYYQTEWDNLLTTMKTLGFNSDALVAIDGIEQRLSYFLGTQRNFKNEDISIKSFYKSCVFGTVHKFSKKGSHPNIYLSNLQEDCSVKADSGSPSGLRLEEVLERFRQGSYLNLDSFGKANDLPSIMKSLQNLDRETILFRTKYNGKANIAITSSKEKRAVLTNDN